MGRMDMLVDSIFIRQSTRATTVINGDRSVFSIQDGLNVYEKSFARKTQSEQVASIPVYPWELCDRGIIPSKFHPTDMRFTTHTRAQLYHEYFTKTMDGSCNSLGIEVNGGRNSPEWLTYNLEKQTHIDPEDYENDDTC